MMLFLCDAAKPRWCWRLAGGGVAGAVYEIGALWGHCLAGSLEPHTQLGTPPAIR
jgi:hypothetical protein